MLACVAAIADVMPLRQETRAIVQLGLQYLRQGICQPIQLLANDRYPKWDETLIAFQIVPKAEYDGTACGYCKCQLNNRAVSAEYEIWSSCSIWQSRYES